MSKNDKLTRNKKNNNIIKLLKCQKFVDFFLNIA